MSCRFFNFIFDNFILIYLLVHKSCINHILSIHIHRISPRNNLIPDPNPQPLPDPRSIRVNQRHNTTYHQTYLSYRSVIILSQSSNIPQFSQLLVSSHYIKQRVLGSQILINHIWCMLLVSHCWGQQIRGFRRAGVGIIPIITRWDSCGICWICFSCRSVVSSSGICQTLVGWMFK